MQMNKGPSEKSPILDKMLFPFRIDAMGTYGSRNAVPGGEERLKKRFKI
jgi:hypothetical protein